MKCRRKSRKVVPGILLITSVVFLFLISVTGFKEYQMINQDHVNSEPIYTESNGTDSNATKYSLNDPEEKLEKEHSISYETDIFKMNQMEDLIDEINNDSN